MTDPYVMLTSLTRINADSDESRTIVGKVEAIVRLKAEMQRGWAGNTTWYNTGNYTRNVTATSLRELVVSSIDGKIRDDEWKRKIQMIDKRSMRDQLFRDCMDTFGAVSSEMAEEFWNHWRTHGTVDMTFGDKLDRLMAYVNDQFRVYGNAMNIMAPKLEISRYALEWRVQAYKIRY
jgi:hypothetical protein